jgi:hypothetical protein
MNKQEYLERAAVKDFVAWLIPKISGESKFHHQYYNIRNRNTWSCNSIYNAYENYNWPFKCTLPDRGVMRGNTYVDNEKVLKIISDGLKESLNSQNSDRLLAYCLAVLKWGGVMGGNHTKLSEMGTNIVPYFEETIIKLNPENTNTGNEYPGVKMNAGFSKIYSLLIDDFIIYDSRVGAGLGLLVKQYLTERQDDSIPNELNFAYGRSRTNGNDGPINRRNPSNEMYSFQALDNNRVRHLKNNICANWLLKQLAEQSKFRFTADPMRAIESALFMIGYHVREER